MVKEKGIIPMASIWDPEILNWANPHITIHKVGSGDLTHYKILLLKLAKTDKPIILSTGLSSLQEVADAVKYIEGCNASYVNRSKISVTSMYLIIPTPDDDVNLAVMLTLKKSLVSSGIL